MCLEDWDCQTAKWERGNDRVEVLKKQAVPRKPGEEGVWEEFTGQEVVVQSDLSALGGGQQVTVAARGK